MMVSPYPMSPGSVEVIVTNTCRSAGNGRNGTGLDSRQESGWAVELHLEE